MSYMKGQKKILKKELRDHLCRPHVDIHTHYLSTGPPKNTDIQVYALIFFLNIEIDEYNSHGEIFTWIDKNYISPLNSEDTILIFIIKISLFLIGQTENNVESMVNNWWSYTVLQLPWLLFFLFSMVILTSIFVYF